MGLSAFNIVDVNLFFDGWWTLFIIIPSFINIFAEEEKTGNIIALIVGVLLLLACQDYISFSTIWKLLFPSILMKTLITLFHYLKQFCRSHFVLDNNRYIIIQILKQNHLECRIIYFHNF